MIYIHSSIATRQLAYSPVPNYSTCRQGNKGGRYKMRERENMGEGKYGTTIRLQGWKNDKRKCGTKSHGWKMRERKIRENDLSKNKQCSYVLVLWVDTKLCSSNHYRHLLLAISMKADAHLTMPRPIWTVSCCTATAYPTTTLALTTSSSQRPTEVLVHLFCNLCCTGVFQ